MKPSTEAHQPFEPQRNTSAGRRAVAVIAALCVLVGIVWFAFGSNESPTSLEVFKSFDGEQEILLPSEESGFTITTDSVTYLPTSKGMLGNSVRHLYRPDGGDTATLTVSWTTAVSNSSLVAQEESERLVHGHPSAIWGESVRQVSWVKGPSPNGDGDQVGGVHSTTLTDDELVVLANRLPDEWLAIPEIPGYSYVGTSSLNGINGVLPSAAGAWVVATGPDGTEAIVVTFRGDFEVELGVLSLSHPVSQPVTLRGTKPGAVVDTISGGSPVLMWEEEPGLVAMVLGEDLHLGEGQNPGNGMLEFAEGLELVSVER